MVMCQEILHPVSRASFTPPKLARKTVRKYANDVFYFSLSLIRPQAPGQEAEEDLERSWTQAS